MGILTDIYNTVARFFRAQDEQTGEDASKTVAQNRLKLVLMQDRTNLTPKVLEQMRGEMIELLSKYLEMDKELLELNFEQEGDQVALMLSIPVIRAKDEDEIEAALAKDSEDIDDAESVEEDAEEDLTEEVAQDEVVSEETPKPRKRRSKKVSAPEGLEGNDDESEVENFENHENIEAENNCENVEA